MTDHASEFLKQSQTLAQQSWENWMRALQQGSSLAGSQGATPAFGGMPFHAPPFGPSGFGSPAAPTVEGMVERGLAGMKGYFDWMQQLAGAPNASTPSADWQAQLQTMFGGMEPPFAKAFAGIDSSAAQGFVQQWQAWLTALGQGGMPDFKSAATLNMPAFGLHREHTEQQQALLAAMSESQQQQQRYQALIMRANAQGLERLQGKLAERMEPGREVNSIKALYDLWVDAAEEAYAQIALSEEFAEVYGAMVNAQMRERELQQEQLEQFFRQLGLPTRSDFASLGKRLQELRRAQRADADGAQRSDEVAMLRTEVAELKTALAARSTESTSTRASAPTGKPAAKKAAAKEAAVKKAAAKKSAVKKTPAKKTASKASGEVSTASSKSVSSKSTRSRRTAAKRS